MVTLIIEMHRKDALEQLKQFIADHPLRHFHPFWNPQYETLQFVTLSKRSLRDFIKSSGYSVSELEEYVKLNKFRKI